ncbi:MAG: ornithine--oxo-acid transaminase [Candidatus Liptonbacteria bacterium]|nr:ornithine--oxo-acid transaminase [Candidatus Liptonbacteria bacterium]
MKNRKAGRKTLTAKDHILLNDRYLAHNYAPYPVVMVRGKGVWLWDINGKLYIDCLGCYSAINHGHCHPRIVKVAVKQAKLLTGLPGCLLNDKTGPFGKELATLCKKDKVLLASGGAEAVEKALKVTRKWGEKVKGVEPNCGEIIVFEGNFHGRTIGIVSFSTEEQYRDGFGPLLPGFKAVPYGDILALKKAITPNTVGVLIEPIQGEGGISVPPKGYLAAVRELCTENNVLMVADEIQTGLGRTGKMFACDHEFVVPDVYILAKALGGGYCVSAVVANDDIMDVMTPGDDGSTFGRNPFACAVGYEALRVLVDEKLPEKAQIVGKYFRKQLRQMDSPHVKEVRGKGLLIGVEVEEKSGKASDFVKALINAGVIVQCTHRNTVRFAPPLTITKEEVDLAMKRIRKVFLP